METESQNCESISSFRSTGSDDHVEPVRIKDAVFKTEDQTDWSPLRKLAMSVSRSSQVENVMAVLVAFHVGIMVFEVNAHAGCRNGSDAASDCGQTPLLVTLVNIILLVIYATEICIHLFAYRRQFFFKIWNYVDSCIVFVGLVDWVLSFEENAGIPNLTILRLFRLFKLLRTWRIVILFPEFHDLLRGFAGALWTMFWGAVLILFTLGFWSMLAVEVMPTPSELENDIHGDPLDQWCHDAFSSVLMAMLFFFQTLVAGDSWGACTIPMLRHSPGTVFVFMGTLVCVQLGVTNLILAVIVDAAAAARERDQEARLRRKKQHEKEGLERWRDMVAAIDTDGSGTISLEELMVGFEAHSEVRRCFQLLDVDQRDLQDFFILLDHDNSGDLSYGEFFHDLQKAHTQDIRMYLMHLKLQISRITHALSEQLGNQQAGKYLQRSLTAARPATPIKSSPAEKDVPKQRGPAPEQRTSAKNQSLTPLAKEEVPERRAASMPEYDAFFGTLQAQLDQLTQDASAQAAALVQNTRMLEALLASCGVTVQNSTTSSRSPKGRQSTSGRQSSASQREAARGAGSGPPRANSGPSPRALSSAKGSPDSPTQCGWSKVGCDPAEVECRSPAPESCPEESFFL